jgi:hypothetical protein
VTHTRWTSDPPPMNALEWKRVKEASPRALRETRAWVQGYILALEDVIQDLEAQRDGYLNDPDAQQTLELTLGKVQGTRASAQRTLEAINKIIEEDTDGTEQGQGRATVPGPGV